MVALAACGDDDFNGLPDGPVQPDTSVDTPASGLVKLTITRGTVAQAGVKVYFQDSDSSVVAAMVTDANGVASTVMEAGGFVTAIDPFPVLGGGSAPVNLKTFAGVKPLDELVLHARDPSPPTATVTILANPEPNDAGNSYTLFAPCLDRSGINLPNQGAGSGGVTGQVGLGACGATTDLTIVAFLNGAPIKSINATNVAIADLGTVDLTGEVYVDVENVTFEWTSVPAGIAAIDVTSLLASPRGAQFELLGGAGVDNGTALTSPIPRPAIGGALQINATRAFGPKFGIHNIVDWGPRTSAYSLAMGNILTPTILMPEFSSVPAYDLAAKTVRWTLDATGSQPELIVATTRFNREIPIVQNWFWDIAAPVAGSAEAVRYPVLPAPDDGFNPTVSDAFQSVDEVMIAKVPGGYDAIRENVFASDDPASSIRGSGLVVGATGQVVFEEVALGQAKRTPLTKAGVLSPFADRVDRAKGRAKTRAKTRRR